MAAGGHQLHGRISPSLKMVSGRLSLSLGSSCPSLRPWSIAVNSPRASRLAFTVRSTRERLSVVCAWQAAKRQCDQSVSYNAPNFAATGLSDQMNGAALSGLFNISEGFLTVDNGKRSFCAIPLRQRMVKAGYYAMLAAGVKRSVSIAEKHRKCCDAGSHAEGANQCHSDEVDRTDQAPSQDQDYFDSTTADPRPPATESSSSPASSRRR